MTRICVLGNSHVACLKTAWERMSKDYPDVDVTFFAKGRDALSGLQLVGGRLEPDNEELKSALIYTSGGESSVDINRYDAFLIHGAGLKVFQQAEGVFYTEAVETALFNEIVYSSVSWGLLKKIREVSDVPVYLGHTPLRAARFNPSKRIYTSEYQAYISYLNEKVFSCVGSEVLAQPQETLGNCFSTKLKFSQGSTRLEVSDVSKGGAHQSGDRAHMNEAFGVLFLTELLSKLEIAA